MKVLLKTYGCRANQYDSEAVRAILAAAHVDVTADPAEASHAVFNSCTVTAAAEADLRSDVRNASRVNPGIRSIIMGCAAGVAMRNEQSAPLATLPGVQSVVPGADLTAVAAALGLTASSTRTETIQQTGARALLRIQDGCDEHCTFCATTRARGSSRSRPIAHVVKEAQALALNHPEIVLTGIHIGSYGRDIGSSLGELVDRLIDSVTGARFRLSSIEATEVDDVLVRLMSDTPSRLVPHLHAPLQSASDAVLRRMGRNWYDAASYEASVLRIIGDKPVFALSGDVISGFPGETEADHAATLRLVERLPFTSLHVFPFSERPGTAASRLRAKIPGSVVSRRAGELRRLAAEKSSNYAARRMGGMCDVVITERGKGLTEDYLSVAISDTSLPRRSRVIARLGERDGRLTAFPLPPHD